MADYVIQHYVQKKLLNNFARQAPNGKFKVGFIDTVNFKVGYRNTDKMLYSKNIYDVKGDDVKALEKKLKVQIEDPMMNIVDRLIKTPDNVVITRKELETIKKHILIQMYRNYKNMTGYVGRVSRGIDTSDYDILEGENKLDFWKREMTIILDSTWEKIVQNNHIAIKKLATELNSGFLMFFKTNSEFVINDLGFVMERFPVEIPKSFHEQYIEIARQSGLFYGDERFNELGEIIAKNEIENNLSYMDTCAWMPLSSNFGVANVNGLFKQMFLYPHILSKIEPMLPKGLIASVPFRHLSLPEPKYTNQKLISLNIGNLQWDKLIARYKDENDKYTYKTHLLNEWDTDHFNLLMMNEVFQYLCFKTPEKIIPTIIEYNKMRAKGMDNIKQNYDIYVGLLGKLPPFDNAD